MVSPYLLLRECGRGTRARDATWLTLWGGLYSFLGICKTGRSGKMMPWFWVRRGTPCWYVLFNFLLLFLFPINSTSITYLYCLANLPKYSRAGEKSSVKIWDGGGGLMFLFLVRRCVLMYSCFYLFYFIYFIHDHCSLLFILA